MGFVVTLYAVLLAGMVLGQSVHARHFEITRERRAAEYKVQVTTGLKDGAGTDANVFITIYGSNGESMEKKLKGKLFQNNFEKGQVDNFGLQLADVGELKKIKIRHDNFGFMPAWNLAKVTITAPGGKIYIFPCDCELKKGALSKELFPAGQESSQVPKAVGGCDGAAFKDASHCWPFNEAQGDSSPDLKGTFPAQLKDGAGIVDSKSRGKVASTLAQNSWIDLGDFNERCLSNPNLCIDGVTMIFWAKIDQSAVSKNPQLPKYVFSSGGADKRSRGFALFHENGMFVLRVVAAQKKWRLTIENGNIPFNSWFSFAFTWKEGEGLKYFINGQESGSMLQGEQLSDVSGKEFNDLRISKANSNNVVEEMLPLKFDQLVTWSRVLQPQEIAMAFDQGGGKAANEGQQGNPQACEPNPCINGGTCQLDGDSPDGFVCKCPPAFGGSKCEINEEATSQSTPATPATPTSATPSKSSGASRGATTAGSSTTGSPTSGASATAPSTTAASTTEATTTEASTTGVSTPGASSTRATPTGTATTAAPTSSAGSSTSAASSQAPTTPAPVTTAAPGPMPDIKQLLMDLADQINAFRRLHQSSDVSPSEDLDKEAAAWAQQLAAEGAEKINNSSKYGQLVCSHHAGSDLAKACAVKWYSAIKFFDWADPKLTVKSSPFTQMVWKDSKRVGVGIAKGNRGAKRNVIGGQYFIAAFFDPAQSDEGNIKENVLPAAGISLPAPEASCPEGYFKLPMGGSRSCFSVHNTTVSWDDALLGCALDNGTLASIDCREEADLIVGLLTKSNITEAWIGLHDLSTEGRYVWVDGSPIPFSEWLPGEPDGNEAENCIVQAKGKFGPGWADRHCFDPKAFVCEVPLPGYTFYKLIFNLTEQQPAQSYQNPVYSQSVYPGSYYSMCPPVIQSVNDLLRETITRYFQAKNITVQPIVNTIRCLPNGVSRVEVILRLGPEAGSDSIQSLQISIKENDGELELSNGASAKLISVETLKPGSSYCPNQCVSTACQVGCDPSCCTPTSPSHQMQYPSPAVYGQPEPNYPNQNLWQCPVSCTRNVNFCPTYCSSRCCSSKRRSGVKIHKF